MTTKTNKKWTDDAMRVAVASFVPKAVKMIMGLVPENSKLETILRDYQNYWTTILPLMNGIVLQATNAPDIVDHLLTEISSEVVEAIKEQYKKDGSRATASSKNKKQEQYLLKELMANVPSDINALTQKIALLPKNRREACLQFNVVAKLADAKLFAHQLAIMSNIDFIAWADLMIPKAKPKKKNAIEKSLSSFEKDVKKALNNGGGPLAKWVKNKGL